MSDMKETDFPPPEPQPFVTEEGREIQRLRAELAAMEKQRDEARDTAAAIYKRNWYEAKTEYGTALGKVRSDLAAAIKHRDEAVRALKEIAHQDYRGHPSTESQIARNALAAMRKGDSDGK